MQPTDQERSTYYQHRESERLEFRPVEKEDIALWTPFFEDEVALSHVGMLSGKFKTMTNAERSTAWLERQMERQNTGSLGQLSVVEKATGKFIGVGGIILRGEEGVEDEWEVAYSLLPESRGKGFATEIAIHFRDWAFENTRVKSVISLVHVNNEASQRVTEKNGMHIDRNMIFFEMPVRVNRVFREV